MNFLFEFFFLNFSVNFKSIRERAARNVHAVLPNNYGAEDHEIARAVANITPTDLSHDADGARVHGKFLPMDITRGSMSPIIWSFISDALIWGSLAIVALILASFFSVYLAGTVVMGSTHGGPGVINPAARFVLMTPFFLGLLLLGKLLSQWKVSESGVYIACFIGAILGGLTFFDQTGPSLIKIFYFSAAINFVAALPLGMTLLATYCVINDSDPSESNVTFVNMVAFLSFMIVVFVPFIGPLMGAGLAGVCMVAPSLLVIGYEKSRARVERATADKQRKNGPNEDFLAAEEKRKKQIKMLKLNFEREDDCLFPLDGVTKGIARSLGEPLSWDKNEVPWVPISTFKTHLLITGETGSGKTQFVKSLMRNKQRVGLINGRMKYIPGKGQLPRHQRRAGILVVDGKGGALPRELYAAGQLDYILDPADPNGIKINLVAMFEVGKIGPVLKGIASKTKSDDKIWNDAASSSINHAHVIIVMTLRCFNDPETGKRLRVTGQRLREFCLMPKYRARILESRHKIYGDNMIDQLRDAVAYWESTFVNYPPNTAQSIVFTMTAIFDNIASNPAVNGLVNGEGDQEIDVIGDILTGASVGIALSEGDGDGGTQALKLTISALLDTLFDKRTANLNWREDGVSREVELYGDEFGKIADEMHTKGATMGRSLGFYGTYMVQDVSQIVDALGGWEAADSFLTSVMSMVCFQTLATDQVGTRVTTYKYAASQTGKRLRVVRDGVTVDDAVSIKDAVSADMSDGRRNRSAGEIHSLIGSISTTVTEFMRRFSFRASDKMTSEQDVMGRTGEISGRLVEMPSISDVDMTRHIGGSHIAFVRLRIAGINRMDFIDFTPGILEDEELAYQRTELAMMERMPWLSPFRQKTVGKEKQSQKRLTTQERRLIEMSKQTSAKASEPAVKSKETPKSSASDVTDAKDSGVEGDSEFDFDDDFEEFL